MENLSKDVLSYLFSRFEIAPIVRLREVSSTWKELLDSDGMRQRLFAYFPRIAAVYRELDTFALAARRWTLFQVSARNHSILGAPEHGAEVGALAWAGGDKAYVAYLIGKSTEIWLWDIPRRSPSGFALLEEWGVARMEAVTPTLIAWGKLRAALIDRKSGVVRLLPGPTSNVCERHIASIDGPGKAIQIVDLWHPDEKPQRISVGLPKHMMERGSIVLTPEAVVARITTWVLVFSRRTGKVVWQREFHLPSIQVTPMGVVVTEGMWSHRIATLFSNILDKEFAKVFEDHLRNPLWVKGVVDNLSIVQYDIDSKPEDAVLNEKGRQVTVFDETFSLWSSDGKRFAFAESESEKVKVYAMVAGRLQHRQTLEVPSEPLALIFTSDSLVVGLKNGGLARFPMREPKVKERRGLKRLFSSRP